MKISQCVGPEKVAPVFSQKMSHMVKGVAILMMIAHHCFAFPNYWLDSFSVHPILAGLSNQFKICVAIFAFITGYGFSAGRNVTFAASIRKVLLFLAQYWLQLFLIFLPVASIGFSFSLKRILFNIIALYDNIIVFAWYVFFHCFVVLTFPLMKKLLKNNPAWDLAMVLVGGYCVTVFFYFQPFDAPLFTMLMDCSIYYPVVGMGYLAAKYSIFDRISENVSHKIPTAMLLIALVFFLRSKVAVVKGFVLDIFYAPALILALSWMLREIRFLQPGLIFLGKHSFHMWLFHAIFFSAYTRDVAQPLVSWGDIPFIRFLLVTILSTLAALGVDGLWKYLLQKLRKCTKEKLTCT